ncbi:hypothetical protein L2735_02585 [Shewanella olleyana]|uniref:hypothetical protein n=1 Tax=Shewanella olleyana TaxID=135626 RepID=UPI00200CD8E0|nr:hypothetical protein [Shewanella olleyana]MCL1065694.1 hypothetical protein [Shewanella olleyana]
MHFLTKSAFLLFFIANLVGCDSQPENLNRQSRIVDKTLCQFSQGKCEQNVHGMEISLLINPVFTPSEKPLDIALNFSKPVKNVQVRIEGRDMFMGIIPVKLSTTDYKAYTGNAIYGSCSSDYMVWRTMISFTQDDATKTVWFDFLADNHV